LRKNAGLLSDLEELLEPYTKGDPMSPLKWTNKSMRVIESALKLKGYKISDTTIAEKLKTLGYSLRSNRKEPAIKPSHPDRDAQFEYINKNAIEYMVAGRPVISIDSKKKENIGNIQECWLRL
jgi:hypothetical protein